MLVLTLSRLRSKYRARPESWFWQCQDWERGIGWDGNVSLDTVKTENQVLGNTRKLVSTGQESFDGSRKLLRPKHFQKVNGLSPNVVWVETFETWPARPDQDFWQFDWKCWKTQLASKVLKGLILYSMVLIKSRDTLRKSLHIQNIESLSYSIFYFLGTSVSVGWQAYNSFCTM